jgi:maleate isomerase
MSRVGLLLPSSNTTMEPDLYGMAPKGVTVHTARMMLRDVTPEGLEEMAGEATRAARLLETAEVDMLAYGCTSGSLIRGVEWEKSLKRRLEETAGVPAVTTAGAVVEGLKTLGAERVSVFTPYTDAVNMRERSFLEAHGFRVDAMRGLGLTDNQRIGRVPADQLESFIAPAPGSDAVFVSCTNLPVVHLIERLEERHRLPFVTSNQATMWAALRVLRRGNLEGYGALLSDHVSN